MPHSGRAVKTTSTTLVVFVAAGFLTAQDTRPVPPPLGPGQPSANAQPVPASDSGTRNQYSSESVLCNPPSKTTTHVEVEVVNAAENVSLRQYLDASVLPLIRANWYRLASKAAERAGGQTTVEFTELKDGSVSSVKLTGGAGHTALGDLAVKALSSSAPFPALPADAAGLSVDLRTDFTYEPPATSSTSTMASRTFPPIDSRVCSADETAKGGAECFTPPKAVYAPEPTFTEEARREKIQGRVMLFAMVALDGTVKSVCASQLLGGGLDAIAVETIRTWKFEPARFDGKPCDVPIAVRVDFHLSDDPAAAPLVKYEPVMRSPEPGGPNDHPPNAAMALSPATSSAVTGTASSNPSAPCCEQSEPSRTVVVNGVAEPVYRTAKGLSIPRPTYQLEPEYSDKARKRKIEGIVMLSAVVTSTGEVADIHVTQGLGYGLDEKAVQALSRWKFQPAMKDGKPVSVEIEIEQNFHLH